MIIFSKQHDYVFLRYAGLLALTLMAVFVYFQWQAIVIQIIEWQKHFHELLATHVSAISKNPLKHGFSLIALSFAYGVFHAVGPGHGKAVIIAYLGSHKESLARGAVISLLAAILQSLVAVLLVIVFTKIISIQLSTVNRYAEDITRVSYLLVAGLGVFLFFTACIQQWKRHHTAAGDTSHSEPHSDDHSCCGHHHAHQGDTGESHLKSLGIIISMGIRPCSGAIVVLVYAHLVGTLFYGILATLFMGLGTGISIAGIALGTQLARDKFESLINATSGTNRTYFGVELMLWIRMIGGAVIFLLGLSLFQAATEVGVNHPLF